MAVASNPNDLLVVKREGTSLVGISGHQLAALPAKTELRPQGERGAYTVVSWQGRMGFVLTDDLCEYHAVAEQPQAVSLAVADDRAAGARLGALLLLAGLTAAGAASAIYAFLTL